MESIPQEPERRLTNFEFFFRIDQRRASPEEIAERRQRKRQANYEDRIKKYLRPGSKRDCWEYSGVRNRANYGLLRGPDGRYKLAHRVSYEVANGPIPEGMVVCHKCDNRPCYNPAHLFLGTKADNSADMKRKRRGPTLRNREQRDDQMRREIQLLLDGGITIKRVCHIYGIAERKVYDLIYYDL